MILIYDLVGYKHVYLTSSNLKETQVPVNFIFLCR